MPSNERCSRIDRIFNSPKEICAKGWAITYIAVIRIFIQSAIFYRLFFFFVSRSDFCDEVLRTFYVRNIASFYTPLLCFHCYASDTGKIFVSDIVKTFQPWPSNKWCQCDIFSVKWIECIWIYLLNFSPSSPYFSQNRHLFRFVFFAKQIFPALLNKFYDFWPHSEELSKEFL